MRCAEMGGGGSNVVNMFMFKSGKLMIHTYVLQILLETVLYIIFWD